MSQPAEKSDSNTTFQELKESVHKFQKDRGWSRHHKPKNVAISICIEAAELLEHFQWDETYVRDDKQAIADELADIIFNCLNFADVMDIDIATAFTSKFKRVQEKYPVELFNPHSDSAEEYFRIKKTYRKKEDS